MNTFHQLYVLANSINQAAILGEPHTGFETGAKGLFQCGNCHYYDEGCVQKDMLKYSKQPRLPNGHIKVDHNDCCEFVNRIGKKNITAELTNDQMKERRFLRLHHAKRRVAFIHEHLNAGHTVQLTTHTKATRYTKKHIGMFKATKHGTYVQSGKKWVCIDGCDLRAFP